MACMKDFEKQLNDLRRFKQTLFATYNKEQLIKELSICDTERSDILHEIEFENLNACEGYAAYRALKEIQQRRRIVKDLLEVYDMVAGKAVLRSDRKYTTRIRERIKGRAR